MVRRLISFFGKEIRGLHEAAYLLGFFAILSQILALIRDRLFTHYFGAGEILDVYYAAFRIPDLLFVLVASLFSLYVIIPFLSETVFQSTPSRREFLSRIFSLFTLAIGILSAVAF